MTKTRLYFSCFFKATANWGEQKHPCSENPAADLEVNTELPKFLQNINPR